MPRLNSYQKAIAQLECHPPRFEYIATLSALKAEAKRFIDPYDAESDPTLAKEYGNRLKYEIHKFKKLNRTDPVQVRYTINYLCDYETEEERLELVRNAIKTLLASKYAAFNPKLVYGSDYIADIQKSAIN